MVPMSSLPAFDLLFPFGFWYGMVWYGMVWYGMVWYGMVWYGFGVWYDFGYRHCTLFLSTAFRQSMLAFHLLFPFGMVWYGMVPYGMI
jgi:chloride channel 2